MTEKLVRSFVKLDNFGDKLNGILIDKILGDYLLQDIQPSIDEQHSAIKVFALGSFLSHRLLRSLGSHHRAVIFGLGAGYAEFPIVRTFGLGRSFPAKIGCQLALPSPRSTPPRGEGYAIYWVRGPLSAQLLGLPHELAVGDAGYLIRQCDMIDGLFPRKQDAVSFMPHFTAATSTVGLREACEGIGIRFIDPRASEGDVLTAIAGSRLLITEALHGAVVSDALRVPWVAVKTSEDIFEFKWRDFCSSIGVDYSPASVRVRWNVRYFTGRRPLNLSRYALNRVRSWVSQSTVTQSQTAYDLLMAMARPPTLSSDGTVDRIDREIRRRLDKFLEDLDRGSIFRPGSVTEGSTDMDCS